jgi:hypothetical protein
MDGGFLNVGRESVFGGRISWRGLYPRLRSVLPIHAAQKGPDVVHQVHQNGCRPVYSSEKITIKTINLFLHCFL